ncbi:HPr kinase/phosphorylase [Vulcanibacillus modesticaldus]|uniref:HPr kinase/phosphorylase n=1 Tax=Vulcanibacillus modesticaldus TaxID=337097 RepID=A0A1D2YWN4_9BACI|nr:HPr(Ser) kinase/phosphatase [Vulcanibacillus modesticaldus]OEG00114.1 HPr kinase/phosphorylase [Vulcanibacillus modesticaldus]
MPTKLKVREIKEYFGLELINEEADLDRKITVSDLSRPGLVMAGFYTYYPSERIQILGKTELTFSDGLCSEIRRERMTHLCQEDTPCIIIAHNLPVPSELVDVAKERKIPILRTTISTTRFVSKLTNYLEGRLAPTKTIHGVLIDVYGVGVLIVGNSGIGKSETALELLKRGHRLVADDVVEITQTADNELIGTAPEIIRHLLEIRGVGIIDVMTLFGAGAVRLRKKLTLVIKLEMWNKDKSYERLGLDEEKIKIIDTELPVNTIPVRPGRNLAAIIEVAAMNYRLKSMGYNAAWELSSRLTDEMDMNEL